MANIFISHRLIDAKEAEELALEIQNAGHKVWLDTWEIDLGDSIIGKMNTGLYEADYLILCYSSAGIDAPWISREWMSALARQLNSQGIKIIPILLTGGEPPSILADIKYADLVKDWKTGITDILRSIR